ncbi:uncharacterized protein K452DRAFT_18615 [Aplosporella prunicola CBS 121167]|uniref:choline-phosphate cytidylyltransferase n=1 Tax=Aplosporella prunicola CBS 121167 TaxID=1176127 RepID=A0A6A6BE30_9PEZI|nr:uncharacterized protein K452DRAFT_18615 [Aplosporella prunicola CBS 121167]KAF2142432.1 hypothetical protein K452DRAFT_18615 [Aplosporella prunicola CBS 121167]
MPAKRKRTNTVTSTSAAAVEDVPQPSSRDASGEDTEDPVLQEVKQRQTEAANPSSKRARSIKSEENGDEPEEGRAAKAARQDASSPEKAHGGENGEEGTMRMPPPPKAGIVDPVGYHTNPPPEGRSVRVYADGVFDLFHIGHMRQLQQAKQAFPDTTLIVGVTGDKETHRRKGLTVLSARERAESVRHCKWVDEVIEDCPWIVTPDFMEKHQIDYVAHDDIPYGANEGDDIYSPIKREGKFLVTQRTEGLSTTGIITKIVRDYDQYIQRQLKRGTSRQELNVSWLKKNELEIKRSVGELRDNIRNNWATTGQELGRELRSFWQQSRPGSPARSPVVTPSSEHPPKLFSSPSAAVQRLSHLEIPPRQGSSVGGESRTQDFAAGYSLGLVSSVRSWVRI